MVIRMGANRRGAGRDCQGQLELVKKNLAVSGQDQEKRTRAEGLMNRLRLLGMYPSYPTDLVESAGCIHRLISSGNPTDIELIEAAQEAERVLFGVAHRHAHRLPFNFESSAVEPPLYTVNTTPHNLSNTM